MREKMTTVTISKQAAEVALRNLWEHYQEVYVLDAETRAGIAALDEFVRALDAEQLIVEWEEQRQTEYREMMATYEARKAAGEVN